MTTTPHPLPQEHTLTRTHVSVHPARGSPQGLCQKLPSPAQVLPQGWLNDPLNLQGDFRRPHVAQAHQGYIVDFRRLAIAVLCVSPARIFPAGRVRGGPVLRQGPRLGASSFSGVHVCPFDRLPTKGSTPRSPDLPGFRGAGWCVFRFGCGSEVSGGSGSSPAVGFIMAIAHSKHMDFLVFHRVDDPALRPVLCRGCVEIPAPGPHQPSILWLSFFWLRLKIFQGIKGVRPGLRVHLLDVSPRLSRKHQVGSSPSYHFSKAPLSIRSKKARNPFLVLMRHCSPNLAS